MIPEHSKQRIFRPKFFVTAVYSWLIAGTLDALAAIFIFAGGDAGIIFRYIASAVYGNAAFSRGMVIVLAGVAFHYFITGCFTAFYFFIYRYIGLFRKSRLWSIVIYGAFTWAVMNVVLLPLTKVHLPVFTLRKAVLDMAILMFTIGTPLTLAAYSHQRKKNQFSR